MATRSMRVRRLSNTASGFVAFVGILVAVALIGQHHTLRVDLSESKRSTLSDQSRKILAGLKGEISIKAFFEEAGGFSLKAAQRVMEKTLIIQALQETGGNRTHASRLLEISHPTLLSKIKTYEIGL